MSLERVLAWAQRLRGAPLPQTRLSMPGLRLVVDDALDALADLPKVCPSLGHANRPFEVGFVAASTVVTAPIEWCALLMAAGAAVRLKVSRRDPGLGPWLTEHAAACGLPLSFTDAPEVVREVDAVIAMGGDEALAAIRAATPAPVLGFGHRVSVGWWPAGVGDEIAPAFVRDLVAHDGRGCMTPTVLFTDERPDHVVALLESSLVEAAARWPVGVVSDYEAAAMRARAALVRVVGQVRAGAHGAVHLVPEAWIAEESHPRVVQVVVADEAKAMALAARWPLSTVGTPSAGAWVAPRVCAPGAMQRPPLRRAHDGVDHLRQIAAWLS